MDEQPTSSIDYKGLLDKVSKAISNLTDTKDPLIYIIKLSLEDVKKALDKIIDTNNVVKSQPMLDYANTLLKQLDTSFNWESLNENKDNAGLISLLTQRILLQTLMSYVTVIEINNPLSKQDIISNLAYKEWNEIVGSQPSINTDEFMVKLNNKLNINELNLLALRNYLDISEEGVMYPQKLYQYIAKFGSLLKNYTDLLDAITSKYLNIKPLTRFTSYKAAGDNKGVAFRIRTSGLETLSFTYIEGGNIYFFNEIKTTVDRYGMVMYVFYHDKNEGGVTRRITYSAYDLSTIFSNIANNVLHREIRIATTTFISSYVAEPRERSFIAIASEYFPCVVCSRMKKDVTFAACKHAICDECLTTLGENISNLTKCPFCE